MAQITQIIPATADPAADCAYCPRLAAFRCANREAEPNWHNAPVASFGPPDARLLIVGLAPGMRGANRTARPFTGDWAGDLLYQTISRFGFSRGTYDGRADDGLELIDCRITNAVRCVPPQNKPKGVEIHSCAPFLAREISELPRLKVVLALGLIAHGTVLSILEQRKSAFRFAHGAVHRLHNKLWLADSYHCSRYNTNTGRLTTEMFEAVFVGIRRQLDRA
ncbi:MAG: uracil-DNA glycosylase [Rhodospirillaceae bacterium]|nr:uracil-DNA glycosylase [Rhodospirillaceae bacterium]